MLSSQPYYLTLVSSPAILVELLDSKFAFILCIFFARLYSHIYSLIACFTLLNLVLLN